MSQKYFVEMFKVSLFPMLAFILLMVVDFFAFFLMINYKINLVYEVIYARGLIYWSKFFFVYSLLSLSSIFLSYVMMYIPYYLYNHLNQKIGSREAPHLNQRL